jgi:hypothetical protein
MDFSVDRKDIKLPAMDIMFSMKDQFVRFTAPLVLVNRSGVALDYCDATATDQFITHLSRSSMEHFLPHVTNASASISVDYSVEKSTVLSSAIRNNSNDARHHSINRQHSADVNHHVEVIDDDAGGSDIAGSAFARKSALLATRLNFNLPHKTSYGSQNKTYNVVIHLPTNHLRKIEIVAHGEWTLAKIFHDIKHSIASASAHRQARNYTFCTWENGKLGPRKVDNSMIVDNEVPAQAAATDVNNAVSPPLASSSASLVADDTSNLPYLGVNPDDVINAAEEEETSRDTIKEKKPSFFSRAKSIAASSKVSKEKSSSSIISSFQDTGMHLLFES